MIDSEIKNRNRIHLLFLKGIYFTCAARELWLKSDSNLLDTPDMIPVGHWPPGEQETKVLDHFGSSILVTPHVSINAVKMVN